jgi:hypothetical protein
MDEVELLKALGDVWSDATKIIESMHALRKKIEELLEDAQGDDELAEIYELVHNQIKAVMSSLRISQARIESSVMGALPAASFTAAEEDGGEEGHNGGEDSAAEAKDAEAELADAKAAQPNQESAAEATSETLASAAPT